VKAQFARNRPGSHAEGMGLGAVKTETVARPASRLCASSVHVFHVHVDLPKRALKFLAIFFKVERVFL
jgi:hypothetical protein